MEIPLKKRLIFLPSYWFNFIQERVGADLWTAIEGHRQIFKFIPYRPWDDQQSFSPVNFDNKGQQ